MLRRWLASLTLGRRLVLAFTLMMGAVAALYSAALYFDFRWVEMHLSSRHMADQLHAKEQALFKGIAPQVNPGVWLYSNHPLWDSLPEKFAAAPNGFSEIAGDPPYFVFREQKNGYDFLLVTDQSQFIKMEKNFFRAVLLFSLLVTALGLIWGRIFYRIVMNPVCRLADEVTRASLSPHYVPVEVPPKQDAISVLASCCDTALKKLHSALSRERSYTGDVSHEIRNPLNVIEGSLELLELSELTDKQRRQVERAGVAAGFLQLLIEDFLSMARDSSKISASGDDTLSVVFDHMREVWTPEAQKRGLALKIEKTGQCRGAFPVTLLASVANNLIRNAVHYTHQGSVVLKETASGFAVIDSGGGISEDELERLFKPFERGSGKDQDETGYGLGLSIVERICRRCGWTVRHENVPGGSCFTVTLNPQSAGQPAVQPE